MSVVVAEVITLAPEGLASWSLAADILHSFTPPSSYSSESCSKISSILASILHSCSNSSNLALRLLRVGECNVVNEELRIGLNEVCHIDLIVGLRLVLRLNSAVLLLLVTGDNPDRTGKEIHVIVSLRKLSTARRLK